MIATKIFHVTVLLLVYTFAINLWHRKFVTADVTAVFVNNQHGIHFSDENKMLTKINTHIYVKYTQNTQLHA